MPDHSARRAALPAAALFDAATRWLSSNYPGCLPESLVLVMRDPLTRKKRKIRFPIIAGCDAAPEDDGPRTPMEQDILLALANDTLRGEEICERAGYSWGGRFRSTLARMVSAGLLEKTAEGYRLGQ